MKKMIEFLDKLMPKKKSILSQKDIEELNEIERKSYMEEARIIVKERGKVKAKQQLELKEKPKEPWQMS